MSLLDLSADKISSLSDEDLRLILSDSVKFQKDDVKENQLLYYRPVSEKAKSIHLCEARTVGVGGGNRSSKTTTLLAEHIIALTGVVPLSLRADYPMSKLRGPINGRIILESLTTVLHPIMLPKLQYWRWNGPDEPGGARGHFGLIPRTSLIDGSWEKSWSEKNRLLRLYYRDPVSSEIMGESTLQFMSHDQDPSDFSSGDLHIVQIDEPPKFAIWRENQARTMAVKGRILLGMTWPDDASIPVDWLFDEVYDRAQPGPNKDPQTEWFELFTLDNNNIDLESVRYQMAKWSDKIKAVRIYGRPMRFSNRIHPLFTDILSGWCFKCGQEVMLEAEKCTTCGAEDVTTYCHTKEFDHSRSWPVICALDPHPRKPHMLAWFAVDTYDDLWQIAEVQIEGDCTDVRKRADEIERMYGMNVAMRIMDPNMGASPSGQKRGITWQSEFRDAGLRFDLADDSDVGRSRFNEYLKPDPRRLQPRAHVHSRCATTIFQIKRFCWAEHKQSLEKDLKQIPKPNNDDFPALWRYVLNTNPTFTGLTRGAGPISW